MLIFFRTNDSLPLRYSNRVLNIFIQIVYFFSACGKYVQKFLKSLHTNVSNHTIRSSRMTNIDKINHLNESEFKEHFFNCCGSTTWVNLMYQQRPFKNLEHLLTIASQMWNSEHITKNDILEAFSHHPKIGDINALREKFKKTADLCANEQKSVQYASDQVLKELKEYNEKYEKKFGYIFIVCATGKSAEEMLNILKSRYPNDEKKELKIAAGEQEKITAIRLKNLVQNSKL